MAEALVHPPAARTDMLGAELVTVSPGHTFPAILLMPMRLGILRSGVPVSSSFYSRSASTLARARNVLIAEVVSLQGARADCLHLQQGPVSVSSRPQAFRVPTNTESRHRRNLGAGETGTSPGLEIGNRNLYSCYWQKTLIPVMKLRWEGQLGPV